MQRGLPNLLGSLLRYLAVTSTVLLTTGCFSYPYVTGIVHESSQGSVYLDEVPDLAFEASHPVSMEDETLARILRGVHVVEQKEIVLGAGARKPVVRYAFSEESAMFLAPLLANALNVAGRGDQVVFRLIHATKSAPLATAGTLYVHESYVYLTLTHYHYKARDANILYTRRPGLPYSSALTRRRVRFTPKDLGQPTHQKPPGAPAQPTLTTLAIDYTRLADTGKQTPGTPGQDNKWVNGTLAPGKAVRGDELTKARRVVAKKQAELKVLKERLRVLKKKLAAKEQLIKKLKKKKRAVKRKKKKRAAKKKR